MEKNLTKTKQQQYFFGDTPVTVHFVKGETITDRATKKKDDRDDAKKKRRKRRDICVLYISSVIPRNAWQYLSVFTVY